MKWFKSRFYLPKPGAAGGDFFKRYRRVLSACLEIEGHVRVPAHVLSAKYMKLVSKEDETWWEKNGEDASEVWFVYDYLVSKGVLSDEEELYKIATAEDSKAGCLIKTVTDIGGPDTGRIELMFLSGFAPAGRLSAMGYVRNGSVFVREIGDAEARLMDRASEIGAYLLENGFFVYVQKAALRDRILSGDFEKESEYRVFAPENELEIGFRYPWNPVLHKYLFRAGAKWNGKYMAMPVVKAENALDLIEMYSFYVEPAAKKRMNKWILAKKCELIYKKRGQSTDDDIDRMRAFLDRPINVIDDLIDDE